MSAIVVMGVSGAGKSSVGRALADATGAWFVEGDDLHPPANVERMRSGRPLTETMRQPWLDAISAAIAQHEAAGREVVAACSALTRTARDRLRAAGPVRFVFLAPDRAELRRRVEGRAHSFMPPELLDDQLDTLEDPRGEDDVLAIEPGPDVASTVAAVLGALGDGG